MAEETPPQVQEKSAFDEAKIAELMKTQAAAAMRETLEAFRMQQQQQQTPPAETTEPDYFESLIDTRTAGKLASLGLKADSAEDKADFYSSDFWEEEIDEYLTGDTPEEIKAEKKELRKKIEANFKDLIAQGKGMQRDVVAKHALAEHLVEKRAKYEEKVVKRSKRKEENELEKARAAVNIGASAVANFNAQDVHNMEYEKVVERFGELVF